jgi:hypothetical protein
MAAAQASRCPPGQFHSRPARRGAPACAPWIDSSNEGQTPLGCAQGRLRSAPTFGEDEKAGVPQPAPPALFDCLTSSVGAHGRAPLRFGAGRRIPPRKDSTHARRLIEGPCRFTTAEQTGQRWQGFRWIFPPAGCHNGFIPVLIFFGRILKPRRNTLHGNHTSVPPVQREAGVP